MTPYPYFVIFAFQGLIWGERSRAFGGFGLIGRIYRLCRLRGGLRQDSLKMESCIVITLFIA